MASVSGVRELAERLIEPEVIRWSSRYLKRLLIERPKIRAKLENPGGSVILGATTAAHTMTGPQYSSSVGNDFHLDLIEAESQYAGLSRGDQLALARWADSLPERIEDEFRDTKPGAIRVRQMRAAQRLVDNLNVGDTPKTERP